MVPPIPTPVPQPAPPQTPPEVQQIQQRLADHTEVDGYLAYAMAEPVSQRLADQGAADATLHRKLASAIGRRLASQDRTMVGQLTQLQVGIDQQLANQRAVDAHLAAVGPQDTVAAQEWCISCLPTGPVVAPAGGGGLQDCGQLDQCFPSQAAAAAWLQENLASATASCQQICGPASGTWSVCCTGTGQLQAVQAPQTCPVGASVLVSGLPSQTAATQWMANHPNVCGVPNPPPGQCYYVACNQTQPGGSTAGPSNVIAGPCGIPPGGVVVPAGFGAPALICLQSFGDIASAQAYLASLGSHSCCFPSDGGPPQIVAPGGPCAPGGGGGPNPWWIVCQGQTPAVVYAIPGPPPNNIAGPFPNPTAANQYLQANADALLQLCQPGGGGGGGGGTGTCPPPCINVQPCVPTINVQVQGGSVSTTNTQISNVSNSVNTINETTNTYLKTINETVTNIRRQVNLSTTNITNEDRRVLNSYLDEITNNNNNYGQQLSVITNDIGGTVNNLGSLIPDAAHRRRVTIDADGKWVMDVLPGDAGIDPEQFFQLQEARFAAEWQTVVQGEPDVIEEVPAGAEIGYDLWSDSVV